MNGGRWSYFRDVSRCGDVVQSPSSSERCRGGGGGGRSSSLFGCCRVLSRCLACCRRSCRLPTKRSGTYESVGADTSSTTVPGGGPGAAQTPSLRSPAGASDEGGVLAAVRGRRADWAAAVDAAAAAAHGVESAYELERADRYTEASRIKVRSRFFITLHYSEISLVAKVKDTPRSAVAIELLQIMIMSGYDCHAPV